MHARRAATPAVRAAHAGMAREYGAMIDARPYRFRGAHIAAASLLLEPQHG